MGKTLAYWSSALSVPLAAPGSLEERLVRRSPE
jgi:hypothetical protein